MVEPLAAVIAALVGVGLYQAFRFLPDSTAPGRPVISYPVGQEAVILEIATTPPSDGSYQGRVRVLGGEAWRARLNLPAPHLGQIVRVSGGEGATLLCAARDARPLADMVAADQQAPLLWSELGRTMAAGLGVALASIALLAMIVTPRAAGMALFGFFAPFAVVLALIVIGSPERGPGCTLRGLRVVVAGAFGLATFLGLTWGISAALAPGCAGLVLLALDPTLGAIYRYLPVGGGH